jgi:dihydropteroate synthase
MAVMQGAAVVRVHDVAAARDAVAVADAIRRDGDGV